MSPESQQILITACASKTSITRAFGQQLGCLPSCLISRVSQSFLQAFVVAKCWLLKRKLFMGMCQIQLDFGETPLKSVLVKISGQNRRQLSSCQSSEITHNPVVRTRIILHPASFHSPISVPPSIHSCPAISQRHPLYAPSSHWLCHTHCFWLQPFGAVTHS